MDDEVLGCGGAIARHVAAGDEVHVAILCNRAYQRTYDPAAIEAEKASAQAAQKCLGYQQLHFFDLPDERLGERFTELLDLLEKLATQIQPESILIPHAGDLHQDHRIAAHAANIALRPAAVPFVRRILAYEIPSATHQVFPGTAVPFTPNFFVKIDKELKAKCAAMKVYERESRPFPHPRSPEMLEALARVRGAQCGHAAAEAFMLMREQR